jgi:hypothetical protein
VDTGFNHIRNLSVARKNSHGLSPAAYIPHMSARKHPERIVSSILAMLLLIFSTESVSAQSTYVVKRGDTLTAIARKHGTSASALAERNGLSKNHFVTVGQRLIVPSAPSASSSPPSNPGASNATGSSTLPKSVTDALNNAAVRSGRWKYIVIHHSAVDEGTVRGMDAFHRNERHMEHGLAYHFVIGNGNGMRDGEVAVGNRWKEQLDGGHLRSESQNKTALGICLVGNFDARPPTARQLQSLDALARALMKRCNISAAGVKTHQQINVISTRCPGKKFPTKTFLNGLKQRSR